MLVAGMVTAQQPQTIARQLKLTNVPPGTKADSILVRGTDAKVKYIARSSFAAPVVIDTASATKAGIVNNVELQELGGVDKLISGVRIGVGLKKGGNNTVLGAAALGLNDGSYNTAVGRSALNKNTTGGYNTSVGAYSLFNNTTSSDNTAIGASAMQNNTTGASNTAVGRSALAVNTTGVWNVAIGRSALNSFNPGVLVDHGYNTALGCLSQQTAQGEKNTTIGYLSGNKITGGFNTTLGFQSGRALTTGNRNILIEMPFNDGLTTGSNNIVIDGANQCGVITGSGNTVIGGYNGSVPNASDQVYIGTGSGISRFQVSSTGIYRLVAGAPVFADNAAALAGNLVAGDLYRTSTGILMIVY